MPEIAQEFNKEGPTQGGVEKIIIFGTAPVQKHY